MSLTQPSMGSGSPWSRRTTKLSLSQLKALKKQTTDGGSINFGMAYYVEIVARKQGIL